MPGLYEGMAAAMAEQDEIIAARLDNDDEVHVTTNVANDPSYKALVEARLAAQNQLRRSTDPERTYTESAIVAAVRAAGSPYPSDQLRVVLEALGIPTTRKIIVAVSFDVPIAQEVDEAYLDEYLPQNIVSKSVVFDPNNGDEDWGVAAVNKTTDGYVPAGDIYFAAKN